jgi:hypothetical protein
MDTAVLEVGFKIMFEKMIMNNAADMDKFNMTVLEAFEGTNWLTNVAVGRGFVYLTNAPHMIRFLIYPSFIHKMSGVRGLLPHSVADSTLIRHNFCEE